MKSSNFTLIHFHIPKTAGITLIDILRRKYNEKLIHLSINTYNKASDGFTFINDFINLENKYKGRDICLTGHFPYGIHKYISTNYKYITVLRDPIQRVISDYHYTLNTVEHPFNKYYFKNKKISLEDYIKLDPTENNPKMPDNVYISSAVSDLQYKSLSGRIFNNFYKPDNEINNLSFDEVKKNISKEFLVIGTFEKFDYFLILLKKYMKWNNFNIVSRRLNVSKNRQTISAKIISLIEKYNSQDMELYEYVKKRFEKQIKDEISNKELKNYNFINKFSKNIIRISRINKRLNTIFKKNI